MIKENVAPENNANAFLEAAIPMIKYLCKNHNPHVSVIITPTGAELLEGIKSTGEITEYVQD